MQTEGNAALKPLTQRDEDRSIDIVNRRLSTRSTSLTSISMGLIALLNKFVSE
jgi:hypothetical protein